MGLRPKEVLRRVGMAITQRTVALDTDVRFSLRVACIDDFRRREQSLLKAARGVARAVMADANRFARRTR